MSIMADEDDPDGYDRRRLLEVREAVRYEFAQSRRVTKNGESWKEYLFRQFTVDRAAMLAILLVQFGGGWRDAQESLKKATDQAVEAVRLATVATQKADETAQTIALMHAQLATVADDHKRAEAEREDIRDRMARSVTRAEFSSALAQQVLPRLERIEQRLWDAGTRLPSLPPSAPPRDRREP